MCLGGDMPSEPPVQSTTELCATIAEQCANAGGLPSGGGRATGGNGEAGGRVGPGRIGGSGSGGTAECTVICVTADRERDSDRPRPGGDRGSEGERSCGGGSRRPGPGC